MAFFGQHATTRRGRFAVLIDNRRPASLCLHAGGPLEPPRALVRVVQRFIRTPCRVPSLARTGNPGRAAAPHLQGAALRGSTHMLSLGSFATKIFGSANDRKIKSLRPKVDAINALEPEIAKLSDAQLRARTAEFRRQVANGAGLDELLVPAFATVREAAKRT